MIVASLLNAHISLARLWVLLYAVRALDNCDMTTALHHNFAAGSN